MDIISQDQTDLPVSISPEIPQHAATPPALPQSNALLFLDGLRQVVEATYLDAERLFAGAPRSAALVHEGAVMLHLAVETEASPKTLALTNSAKDLGRDPAGAIAAISLKPRKGDIRGGNERRLSASLGDRLQRHIDIFRPLISSDKGDLLFPTRDNQPATTLNIRARILFVTKKQIAWTHRGIRKATAEANRGPIAPVTAELQPRASSFGDGWAKIGDGEKPRPANLVREFGSLNAQSSEHESYPEPPAIAEPLQTLADALAFVRRHNLLTAPKLAEVNSAIRLLERVIGLKADRLPAAPKRLTPLIEAALPARHRVLPKRWSNGISSIRSLLRPCGLHAPLVKHIWPTNQAWIDLVSSLPTTHERAAMAGFARWCAACDIEPTQVTEQTVEEYIRFRAMSTIRTHLNELRNTIRGTWNRAVQKQLEGWPSRLLVAPGSAHIIALPLDRFPAQFQAELTRYLSDRTHPDAFNANHRQWRNETAKEACGILLRTASLNAARLGGVEHIPSLAAITTIEAVEFVLKRQYEAAGGIWRPHAANMATCLLVVARDFVRVDQATVTRLSELRDIIVKRVRERRVPGLSERIEQQLMPFRDPKLVRRFFQLPAILYADAAERLKSAPVRAAQMNEQALLLDLEQHDPMRRYNLASINYQEDFVRNERAQIEGLWISGARTKNGVVIDTPVPAELRRRIERHLADYRPYLRGSDSPWLFPSPEGNPRSPDNITNTIGRVIRRRLGVTCPPHLIRHIIATLLFLKDPANGVVVQRKLRHTSVKTTERMYGTLSNASANAAWQTELDCFRRTKAATDRRKANRRTVLPGRGV